ncbi:MAG: SLBB domain-containing protein [Pyrinomonadaceae bacterium]
MKTLKVVLAIATLCSIVAPPAGAQQKPVADTQPPVKQGGAQPDPGATPITTPIALKESATYTAPHEYLLGPADLVELRVFNDAQFGGDFEVDPDGNIVVPFIDQPIHAQCRSVTAVTQDVKSALGKFLKEPRVYMRVKEQKSHKPVVIYGAVRSAAPVEMRRPVRLLELVSSSGGVTEQHSGTIQIMHTEPPQCPDLEPFLSAPVQSEIDPLAPPFSIYKVDDLRQGKPEANPYLRPGDIVYVAEAPPVYVVGSVAQPANLYLREGTMLTRVIAQVGGLREANEEKVTIHRQKSGGEQELIPVNYKLIKQGKAPDVALQPYDIIEVPKRGQLSVGNITKIIAGIGLQGVTQMGTSVPMRIIY